MKLEIVHNCCLTLHGLRTQVFDPRLGLPRPWQFANLAQHAVIQARLSASLLLSA
jgi:hypothetical protein